MIDEEDLRRMSPQDRLRLRRVLADLDSQDAQPDPAGSGRRRALFLAVAVVSCIVLVVWIGVLAATLPRYYRTGGWRGAWVGFDVGLLAAFAAAAWAAWRRKQILVICLVVLATLLCCDAWFDVVLDARTSGFWLSLGSALLIELPLAAFAILGARRLLRASFAVMGRYRGESGPVPRLREMPLVGAGQGRPLSDLLARPQEVAAHEVAAHGWASAAPASDSAPGRGVT